MFPFKSRRPKKKSSEPAVAVNPLGYDFAVLGLSSRECRTGIIRKAADRAVEKAQSVAADGKERSELTAQVVTSTYRLLDPRRRLHPPRENSAQHLFRRRLGKATQFSAAAFGKTSTSTLAFGTSRIGGQATSAGLLIFGQRPS